MGNGFAFVIAMLSMFLVYQPEVAGQAAGKFVVAYQAEIASAKED